MRKVILIFVLFLGISVIAVMLKYGDNGTPQKESYEKYLVDVEEIINQDITTSANAYDKYKQAYDLLPENTWRKILDYRDDEKWVPITPGGDTNKGENSNRSNLSNLKKLLISIEPSFYSLIKQGNSIEKFSMAPNREYYFPRSTYDPLVTYEEPGVISTLLNVLEAKIYTTIQMAPLDTKTLDDDVELFMGIITQLEKQNGTAALTMITYNRDCLSELITQLSNKSPKQFHRYKKMILSYGWKLHCRQWLVFELSLAHYLGKDYFVNDFCAVKEIKVFGQYDYEESMERIWNCGNKLIQQSPDFTFNSLEESQNSIMVNEYLFVIASLVQRENSIIEILDEADLSLQEGNAESDVMPGNIP